MSKNSPHTCIDWWLILKIDSPSLALWTLLSQLQYQLKQHPYMQLKQHPPQLKQQAMQLKQHPPQLKQQAMQLKQQLLPPPYLIKEIKESIESIESMEHCGRPRTYARQTGMQCSMLFTSLSRLG